jgi:hypothetical protein
LAAALFVRAHSFRQHLTPGSGCMNVCHFPEGSLLDELFTNRALQLKLSIDSARDLSVSALIHNASRDALTYLFELLFGVT